MLGVMPGCQSNLHGSFSLSHLQLSLNLMKRYEKIHEPDLQPPLSVISQGKAAVPANLHYREKGEFGLAFSFTRDSFFRFLREELS